MPASETGAYTGSRSAVSKRSKRSCACCRYPITSWRDTVCSKPRPDTKLLLPRRKLNRFLLSPRPRPNRITASEEVEAVINQHEAVRISRARSRKSPITGAIVVADVVLADLNHADRHETIRAE